MVSYTCICESSKHLKHIVDDSVIVYYEIIYVMDIVSRNVLTNSDDKKVKYKMNCYIWHKVLIAIILLLLIL